MQNFGDFSRNDNRINYSYKMIESPDGKLKLAASEKGLAAILGENDHPRRVRQSPVAENKSHPILLETERQLKGYFDGTLPAFSIKIDPVGTKFQNRVGEALLSIPSGETRSYTQIARQIGHEKAVRAVGAANGRNPIGIIVPRHRVIGSSGQLTGFAGGLETKERLLTLESRKGGGNKWKALAGPE